MEFTIKVLKYTAEEINDILSKVGDVESKVDKINGTLGTATLPPEEGGLVNFVKKTFNKLVTVEKILGGFDPDEDDVKTQLDAITQSLDQMKDQLSTISDYYRDLDRRVSELESKNQ